MKLAVITVSDRASRGEYADRSGPAMLRAFQDAIPDLSTEYSIVSDDQEAILAALQKHQGCDWIFTTGGTGPGPRDITPEATRAFIDREMPGLADYLRLESLKETSNAVFSRGIAGMHGNTFVVNAPGSERAALLCARLFSPLLLHGCDMVQGRSH
ncbi:MAG: MogA/MoaB family molybdenum cofactor biosynthesis protein [Spirochaetes bacterium]|nr:MogA/MoaB family molybdenum cofactor biosynthesis protein [Spirochaetota bacterium]MBU0956508.1 MogA/MoaB family molybdenum cofactor biosynthesis protein [Spirochaetota bacterium]